MRAATVTSSLALAGLLALASAASLPAATSAAETTPTAAGKPAVKTLGTKPAESATAPSDAGSKPEPKPAASASAANPAAGGDGSPAATAPKPAAAPAVVDPGQAWIKPFPGSSQTARTIRRFDEYWMALGELVGDAQATKVTQLEGRWIHGAYATRTGPSVAEVFRHYEQQVAGAGFAVVYSCKGVECGEGGRKTNGDWWALSEHRRYLVARLERPTGDVWVSVHVHARGPTTAVSHEIDVVEARPPVVPPPPRNEADVATLQKELKADGRVVLRDIGFSDGRPAVLPGSEPIVQAIADLLARDPSLKLHVVVHCDDAAPWGASMDLTKKQAQALTALLTRKHGVASARVQPAGVGSLAPVTSNATEEGRALNRRVELVPQAGSRAAGPAAARR